MADIILGSVVGSILRRLAALASHEIAQASCVKVKLEKLETTVSAIGAVLDEAEKRQVEGNHVIRSWLEKLRPVVYDADDLLDDFYTAALRQSDIRDSHKKQILKEVHVFFSPTNQLIYSLKMSSRLESIQERLDTVRPAADGFDFDLLRSHGTEILENRTKGSVSNSFLAEEVVIGRERDKEEILAFLLNPDSREEVSIVAIVGMGGLGKTALAKILFGDERLRSYFEFRLWVCVSPDFNIESILKGILAGLTHGKEYGDSRMDELLVFLSIKLAGRMVFLVLDDLWNEDRIAWFELKQILACAAKGSKILVTTRSRIVARVIDAALIYELSPLSEEDSLSLLMMQAGLGRDHVHSKEFQAIGKEIISNCEGMPLVIHIVGAMLRNQGWFLFKDDLLYRTHKKVMPVLRLSYSYLPSHLKQCFAYCSLFPLDHRIESLELIHLWMAQGYVKSLHYRENLEEVGRDYLMDLVSRSFFTHTEIDADGNIIGFMMNYWMHNLAKLVAGNLCFMLDESRDKMVQEDAFHVSTYLRNFGLMRVEKMKKLRTFLLLGEHRVSHNGSYDWGNCFSRFQKLRALRLQGAPNLRNVSSRIGKLKHLRHLDLSKNKDIGILPSSMRELRNLEILNLKGCSQLEVLPRGISELVSLRQLDITGCDNLNYIPRGIEKLTRLQMLCQFVVGRKTDSNVATLNQLSRLKRLKKLAIRRLEIAGQNLHELDASCLGNNADLRSLELLWEKSPDGKNKANEEGVLERLQPHPSLEWLLVEGYGGDRFPAWGSQLKALVRVEIHGCPNCKHLPSLEKLPLVKSLRLSNMSELKYMEISEKGGNSLFFPSLGRLELEKLPEFQGWRRSNKDEVDVPEERNLMILTLPDRKEFRVHDCPRLSYWKGQFLALWGATDQILKKLATSNGNGLVAVPQVPIEQMAMVSIVSVSLQGLESLVISNLVNVRYLPEELFRSLPFLQSLVIKRCGCLKALNGRAILQYLTALKTLKISMCPKLDLSREIGNEGRHDLQLQEGQSKLVCLSIQNIPKLKFFPGWIQFLTYLESIEIYCCTSMVALPEWFPRLTSLKKLKIQFCDQLQERCKSETGEDWSKISHIPSITM